jgi:hypothetical protein
MYNFEKDMLEWVDMITNELTDARDRNGTLTPDVLRDILYEHPEYADDDS